MKYKLTVRKALIKYLEAKESGLNINIVPMLQETVEEKWKPKMGETYYTPDWISSNLYYRYDWDDGLADKRFFEGGLVCKTKEEAIEKAKKMLAVLQDK
jgi:hypothetical protein